MSDGGYRYRRKRPLRTRLVGGLSSAGHRGLRPGVALWQRADAGVGAREASTPLASLPIIDLVAMSIRRNKKYLVFIEDEEGGTRRYLYTTTSRKRAEKDARDWVGEALAGVERAEVGRARRLLAVAAVTFAVGGAAIAGMMIVGLRLKGAL